MKFDKIKSFFQKKEERISEINPYYPVSPLDANKSLIDLKPKSEDIYEIDLGEINPKKEIKLLRKEVEALKTNFKNEALKKFKTRRSIRKFSDKPIDFEIIHKILEGAINAPCAGNIQNYKIIIIEDRKKRAQLGKLAFQQFWLTDAPILLVIVRDNYKLCQLYPDEGEVYSIQNSAALIENILMLAHFYDIGACWVEAFDNGVLKEYLGIPMEKTVDAIIPLGYPLEKPIVTKENLSDKLFFEAFGKRVR